MQQFQSFGERLKKLNVDVFHRVGTFELAPDQETSSFFRESLDEWTDLDCTAQFSAFATEVWPLCDSLALVVFNRQKVLINN
jgi:U3 small nucleolar RNA-associated protein 20